MVKRNEVCKVCNIEFQVYRSRKTVTYCSLICKRKDYKSWHPVCVGKYVRSRKPKVYKKRFIWDSSEFSYDEKLKIMKSRFEKHVIIKEGCWDWKSVIHHSGYIPLKIGRKQFTAHRVSWLIYKGEIPENSCVLHRCDNRKCTNPEHLFLGSHKDNVQDMISKGRQKHLVGNHARYKKLDDSTVLEIKKLLSLGVPVTKLSKQFNISEGALRAIKGGITWKHITI